MKEFSKWPLKLGLCLNALMLLAGVANTHADGSVAAWGHYYDLTMPETYRPMYVPAGLSNVIAVSGGAYHAVALRNDGRVVVWGNPISSSANVPADLTNAVAIAAGSRHTVALRANGTVVEWGSSPASVVPMGLSSVVAIAAGLYHSLALKADGTVVAWGSNLSGPASVPWGLSGVVQIVAGKGGDFASLALKDDGTVVAWGSAASWTNVPPGLTNVIAIAGGSAHCLALRVDGTVIAWGENFAGQSNVPADLTNVVSIAAGLYHSLALKADGSIVSWGLNNYGQANVPPALTNSRGIAGGGTFSLAIQGDGSPFLILRLQNRTVSEGSRVAFSVTASGDAPLTYHWTFHGTNLPTANSNVLIIADALLRQTGPYSVTVSNVHGSISSTNFLEVVPIQITAQPQNQFAYMGGSALFGVGAEGRSPLGYQWMFNGISILGATNNVLTLDNLRLSDVGDYSVAISNAIGFVVSTNAKLSLTQVAAWGRQTVPEGWTNILAVAAGAQGSMVLRKGGTVSASGFFVTNIPPGLSDVVAIAAGGQFAVGGCSMALRSDGTVVVWGGTGYDQHIIPPGLSNVQAVALGTHHCLALRSDGTVTAWGWGFYGQTSVPAGLSNVVAIAGGYTHSLALTADGSIVSFGTGQSPPPELTNITAIAAGRDHSLALKADGTVVGWGDNYSGQTNVPPDLTNVVGIACGQRHSVALKRDGEVVVWGANDYSQTHLPSGLPKVVAIDAGGVHSLALLEAEASAPFILSRLVDRAVYQGSTVFFSVSATGTQPISYQWCYNGVPMTGETNSTLGFFARAEQAGTYSLIASNAFGSVTNTSLLTVVPLVITQHPQPQSTYVGYPQITFSVGVSGMQPYLYQWQHDGVDIPFATNLMLVLNGLSLRDAGLYSVVVSNSSSFVRSIDAELKVSRVVPWGWYNAPPDNTAQVVGIAGSSRDILAVNSHGTVIAWAIPVFGKTTIPPGLSNAVSIVGGDYYCVALRSDGTLIGWGNNSYGERNIPAGLSNVVAVSAGGVHGLALKADGTVVVWGNNSFNQQAIPSGLSNVVAIAAGRYHSLVVKADGTVVSWGKNSSGQTNVPTFLTNVVSVAGGEEHSLALVADGTAYTWGSQTGSPAGLTNIVAIEGGVSHNLALMADGRVVAWGDNSKGQCNVPVWLTNVVAIAAGDDSGIALIGDGPPKLRVAFVNPNKTADGFSVDLPTRSGRVYRLEHASLLSDSPWIPLPLVAGNGGMLTLMDHTVAGAQRFYRVRQW